MDIEFDLSYTAIKTVYEKADPSNISVMISTDVEDDSQKLFYNMIYDYLHDEFNTYRTMYNLSRTTDKLVLFTEKDVCKMTKGIIKRCCETNLKSAQSGMTYIFPYDDNTIGNIITINMKCVEDLHYTIWNSKTTKDIINHEIKYKLKTTLLHEIGHVICAHNTLKKYNYDANKACSEIVSVCNKDNEEFFNYLKSKYNTITAESEKDLDYKDLKFDEEDIKVYYALPGEKAANDAVGLTYKDHLSDKKLMKLYNDMNNKNDKKDE